MAAGAVAVGTTLAPNTSQASSVGEAMVGLGVDALDTLDPGVQDVVGAAAWTAGKVTGQEIEAPQLSEFHEEYSRTKMRKKKTMNDIMRVANREFAVEGCVLKACVSPNFFGLELWIYAAGTLGELSVEPVASCVYLLEPVVPVESWREILKLGCVWERAYDESLPETRGTLAIFSHEDIDISKISFEYIENDRFRVSWTGITDVHADYFDDFDEIKFEVNCEGIFIGLESRELEPELAIAKAKVFVTKMNWRLKEDKGNGFFCLKR